MLTVKSPAWFLSLLRQLKEREDDDALTPCSLQMSDAYDCVNQYAELYEEVEKLRASK